MFDEIKFIEDRERLERSLKPPAVDVQIVMILKKL